MLPKRKSPFDWNLEYSGLKKVFICEKNAFSCRKGVFLKAVVLKIESKLR
jgi:hypothetical protein